MDKNKQRIAIAEASGWTNVINSKPRGGAYGLPPGERFLGMTGVPDYLNDLNAMHEAEKVLNIRQRVVYADELCRIWTGHTGRAIPYWWYIHEATADQRAEAFLRTLGLWEDVE